MRPAAFPPMSAAVAGPVVLLAEDSEDDAFFFRWTLRKSGLACHLVHVWDGQQAIRYLEACREPGALRPDLVFLDLKMPARTGFEVLEWIRDHPFDPPLDPAVLSGSEHAGDVARGTALGATAYFVKPISASHLQARFAAWRERAALGAPADPARA